MTFELKYILNGRVQKQPFSRKRPMDKKQKYITIVMTLLLVVSVIVERYFLNFNYITKDFMPYCLIVKFLSVFRDVLNKKINIQ